ncbi:hypothetical protein RA27_01590 [Ruegeria sp. ANG-R]|nr:hypothetical protein RA27_01590 [Ruegeria sp. ANG-R]
MDAQASALAVEPDGVDFDILRDFFSSHPEGGGGPENNEAEGGGSRSQYGPASRSRDLSGQSSPSCGVFLTRCRCAKWLIINIPPRSLKSITMAVVYVAYLLGRSPSAKIIVVSYGPDLARTGNIPGEIRTTKGGSRKAISIGSSVTGHGADYIIVDDLLKADDAGSEAELVKAQEVIEGTLLPRFDSPCEGRVVMVAQRLHEMDPPGYLFERGTYRYLNLSAIAQDYGAGSSCAWKYHAPQTG